MPPPSLYQPRAAFSYRDRWTATGEYGPPLGHLICPGTAYHLRTETRARVVQWAKYGYRSGESSVGTPRVWKRISYGWETYANNGGTASHYHYTAQWRAELHETLPNGSRTYRAVREIVDEDYQGGTASRGEEVSRTETDTHSEVIYEHGRAYSIFTDEMTTEMLIADALAVLATIEMPEEVGAVRSAILHLPDGPVYPPAVWTPVPATIATGSARRLGSMVYGYPYTPLNDYAFTIREEHARPVLQITDGCAPRSWEVRFGVAEELDRKDADGHPALPKRTVEDVVALVQSVGTDQSAGGVEVRPDDWTEIVLPQEDGFRVLTGPKTLPVADVEAQLVECRFGRSGFMPYMQAPEQPSKLYLRESMQGTGEFARFNGYRRGVIDHEDFLGKPLPVFRQERSSDFSADDWNPILATAYLSPLFYSDEDPWGGDFVGEGSGFPARLESLEPTRAVFLRVDAEGQESRLTFTLSEEFTPAMMRTEVGRFVDSWPDAEDPWLNIAGTASVHRETGDATWLRRARVRFKVRARWPRVGSKAVEVRVRWDERTRNVLTGAESVASKSRTLSIPEGESMSEWSEFIELPDALPMEIITPENFEFEPSNLPEPYEWSGLMTVRRVCPEL